MTAAKQIAEYFNVLHPNTLSDKQERCAAWAHENRIAIARQLQNDGPATWYSKIEVVKDSGLFTSPNAVETTAASFFEAFGMTPGDLEGKRVLDVGAFSGSMSFFAEDCGAQVFAVDIQDPASNGFATIHKIRKSRVTHVTASIYDLHPDLFGTFDIIIFSGVHYHLKHPLLALERLNSVTKMDGSLLAMGTAGDYWLHKPSSVTAGYNFSKLAATSVSEQPNIASVNEIPLLAFYKNQYLRDDSNWFIPNTQALADMLDASGYDILAANTFPISRDFINAPMACAVIKAQKARDPKQEYSSDVYQHLRRLDCDEPSTTFSIPTWFELEREKRMRSRS